VGSFFTQLVPGPTSSIQEHIHFLKANKFQTLRSDEQIHDHIDMSTHSIEMPFESTPSFHLNRIEEFEYEKSVKLYKCMKRAILVMILCV